MEKDEAINRIKSGNFSDGYGFDMQTLVNAVGALGEMLRNGYTIAPPPHVMTLEEIEAIPEMVWFERRNAGLYAGIPFRLVNADNEMRAVEIHVLDGFVAQMTKWYGKNWRCWTSRPTDEQREETPWDVGTVTG